MAHPKPGTRMMLEVQAQVLTIRIKATSKGLLGQDVLSCTLLSALMKTTAHMPGHDVELEEDLVLVVAVMVSYQPPKPHRKVTAEGLLDEDIPHCKPLSALMKTTAHMPGHDIEPEEDLVLVVVVMVSHQPPKPHGKATADGLLGKDIPHCKHLSALMKTTPHTPEHDVNLGEDLVSMVVATVSTLVSMVVVTASTLVGSSPILLVDQYMKAVMHGECRFKLPKASLAASRIILATMSLLCERRAMQPIAFLLKVIIEGSLLVRAITAQVHNLADYQTLHRLAVFLRFRGHLGLLEVVNFQEAAAGAVFGSR